MVSYLILVVIGVSLIVSGITYNFTSDIVDTFLSVLSTTYSYDSKFTMDADSIGTGNLLLTLFKFFLIPALIVIVWFAISMAQKPEKSY